MSHWSSTKARKVFAAIQRAGWAIKAEKGSSHKQMIKDGREATWAFQDGDEIGPAMMARLAKVYGFTREDI